MAENTPSKLILPQYLRLGQPWRLMTDNRREDGQAYTARSPDMQH